MKIQHICVVALCLVLQAAARPQAEGEGRAPGSRGLLKRGLLAKGKPTTTTTTQAPQEAEYEEDADYAVEGDNAEISTEAAPSSTEGKKLVGSGVRPFRSNTELLETLKRRRAQAAEAKLHGPSSTTAAPSEAPTEAPSKAKNAKKDATPSKLNRNRYGRPSPKAIQEVEEPVEPAPAPAAVPTRTGRTFRRGGN